MSPDLPPEILRAAVAHLAPVVPLLTDLGERFAKGGHELALVGGPVRDAFLGRASEDLDLTTSASPDETEAILADWGDAHWDMGRDFGTIGARHRGYTVEVTTYRADAYDGTTRKPVVAFGDNLEDDLVRRDFTVNAMALRLPDLALVDPHGGMLDLAARRLRTPSSPEVSFSDDPLRMMRAARFVAQLGLVPAPEVLEAMTAAAGTLEIVSAERIRDELVKLILAADPVAGLRVLVDTGLAEQVLPELPALRLEIDEHHRHKDVYEHSLTVLRQAIDLEGPADDADHPVPRPDLVLRLAALLHDIGKPRTRRFEEGGGVSFHHHDVVGAKLTAKRMRALRFDKETTKSVARLVELHLRFHGYGDGAVDRPGGPPICHRRRSAAAAAAPADPSRLHDPQPAQGRPSAPRLRRPRAAHRRPPRAGGAGQGAPRPGRPPDRRGPRHRAGAGPRRGLPLPAAGASRRGSDRSRGGRGAAPGVVGGAFLTGVGSAPHVAPHPGRLG